MTRSSLRLRPRLLAAALAGALALGGLTGCEFVPPTSSDTAAPALMDVVGKPADKAVELLKGAGFVVVVEGEHGQAVTPTASRLVVSQSPEGGAKVADGRTVTIRVGG